MSRALQQPLKTCSELGGWFLKDTDVDVENSVTTTRGSARGEEEAAEHRPPRLYLSWLLKDEEFAQSVPDTTKP